MSERLLMMVMSTAVYLNAEPLSFFPKARVQMAVWEVVVSHKTLFKSGCFFAGPDTPVVIELVAEPEMKSLRYHMAFVLDGRW